MRYLTKLLVCKGFLYYKNELQVQMLLGSRTLLGGYKS
ncbi:hypothetical protein T09_4250 [Trichinella sp. T9]|nr:hypothetical protein T09_4250 [Trichinella sp. T9]